MSSGVIGPGCIIHWKQYLFPDGSGDKADKYFVILGAKQGHNYLAVIATSKQRKRSLNPGCHAEEGYYHILGGQKDWFPLDTWVLLAAPLEIAPSELLSRGAMGDGAITTEGQLRPDVANAIRNCLKLCRDASAAQLALL